MKFESKIGIGEIVVTRQRWREDLKGSEKHVHRDLIGEVIGVTFERNATPTYAVRVISDMSVPTIQHFREHEPVGDPLFNQETGEYPPEDEDEAV